MLDRSRIGTCRKRSGFTLVELLVTFTIIAILGALLAGGVMSWMSGQARRNTDTQIQTLHKAVMQHWDAVVTDAKNEKTIPPAVLAFADNSPDRARVIWIKTRLMEAFPVNFSEIKNAYTMPPLSNIPFDKRRYMANYANSLPAGYSAAAPGKTESAACLLMAIGINRGGIVHGREQLQSFTRDTNNDKVLELIDGWGEPLYFYRFATGNADLQASKPSTLVTPNCDPLDPKGLLGATWGSAKAGLFNIQFHNRLASATEQWYAVPAIASSGRNLVLGHVANSTPPYQDMSIAVPADANDNVYSFRIR